MARLQRGAHATLVIQRGARSLRAAAVDCRFVACRGDVSLRRRLSLGVEVPGAGGAVAGARVAARAGAGCARRSFDNWASLATHLRHRLAVGAAPAVARPSPASRAAGCGCWRRCRWRSRRSRRCARARARSICAGPVRALAASDADGTAVARRGAGRRGGRPPADRGGTRLPAVGRRRADRSTFCRTAATWSARAAARGRRGVGVRLRRRGRRIASGSPRAARPRRAAAGDPVAL